MGITIMCLLSVCCAVNGSVKKNIEYLYITICFMRAMRTMRKKNSHMLSMPHTIYIIYIKCRIGQDAVSRMLKLAEFVYLFQMH